jgi:hypothetical protein
VVDLHGLRFTGEHARRHFPRHEPDCMRHDRDGRAGARDPETRVTGLSGAHLGGGRRGLPQASPAAAE